MGVAVVGVAARHGTVAAGGWAVEGGQGEGGEVRVDDGVVGRIEDDDGGGTWAGGPPGH